MPRTKAELDALYAQFPGLKEAMELAAYCDYHNGRGGWQSAQSGEHDDIHHSDTKHEQAFPREERTIWRGGRK